MVCTCEETTIDSYLDDCPYLTTAYIFAGLSMMLNIRLAYSSAPYALIRFRLPENLFSVFVRRMASALEFWCLPSMLMGNIIEFAQKMNSNLKKEFKLDHKKQQTQNDDKLGTLIKMKRNKFNFIIYPSMVTMWSDFITYLILLIVYVMGDQGHVTGYYFVIAVSGFIFGINMTLVYAADWRYIPVYIAGENSFPMLTSIMHYFTTLVFGNRRKWNSDFLIVTIDIGVAIIISFTTAILWTYSYIMDHKSPDKILRFGVIGWSAYGTTRNTDLTFGVTLNKSGNAVTEFKSNGSITIRVTKGGDGFKQLGSTGTVKINISPGGSIKKYNKEGKLQPFTKGTSDPIDKDTKLDIEATGEISDISGSEVTIKGSVTVTNQDPKALGSSLTLAADTSKDPSSTGLSGTITPTGGGTDVTISGTTIELQGKALKSLLSLTKNAVTLTKTGTGKFRSSATITVTRTSGAADFRTLTGTVNISSINGTIKKLVDGKLTELTRDTPLTIGTELSLDANGKITQPPDASGNVTLTGTIVVTSNDQQIGTDALQFGGGPSREGMGGSLQLGDESSPPPKHIKITNSTLTIDSTAYEIIKNAYDTTSSSFTIGAADPREATGTEKMDSLWHLLPSDRYDPEDLPDWEVISPTLMVIIGMGFVYCIYPGIAPGMIVPFYLVDKIETVLLVLTTFPPVIIAILQKLQSTKGWSPKTTIRNHEGRLGGWRNYTFPFGDVQYDTSFYHGFDILMIIKMSLLVIFIYCLHYRESHISRSVVNQPKMSTFLTIVFYMCHECLLALGFSGVIGNNGATYVVLPAQYVGALLMIFLAFYSEGYIIEYKSHDPQHWPTEGIQYLYGYYQLNRNFLL